MEKFKLPIKRQAKYGRRITLWISEETSEVLKQLEKARVDVPEVARMAIEEFIEKHSLKDNGGANGQENS